jgi:DNA polymerase III subunit epsilon
MLSREELNALFREHHYRWRKVQGNWVLLGPDGYETTVQQAEQAIQQNIQSPPIPVPTWAQQMVRQRALVLDTESTGLHETAEVIELALIALDGAVLLQTLVQCEDSISPEAERIHGINKTMLTDAPTFPEVWEQLASYLDREIIIYNAGYDIQLLKETAARYSIQFPKIHTHCLMMQYTDYIYSGNKRGDYPKLEVASAHFQISPGNHRALADANAARQVVLRLASLT